MKHIHVVVPYQSAAMLRMSGPLIRELEKLYKITTDDKMGAEADLNIHIPFHTLAGEEYANGKHVIAYTHCNPGAVPELLTACSRADIVTAMSFTGRQELLNFGVDPKKIWVIPCAADGFTYRPRRILVVGYPQPNGRKRESILLDLAYQYDLSPYEFYLAGGGWDEMARKLGGMGIKGEVVNPVDDNVLQDFYKSADLLLCTGYIEGGPLPLLEAMASGTRVLSPQFGYASDLLSDEEIYTDVEDLMNKIEGLFSHSVYNHQLVKSWTWEDYCAEYALIIGRLLGESVDLYPERGMSRYAQLLDIIERERPQSICEIGTWNGNNAIRMLQTAGKYHPSKRLYYQGFDLFDEMTGEQFVREYSKIAPSMEIVEKRLKATGAEIELIKGDTFDTMKDLDDVAIYFVDGGHSEFTIGNDAIQVLFRIMDGSSIAIFDDYYHDGKPEGMGCNNLIDNLESQYYEITHLPARTTTQDGVVIGMVQVKRANLRLQMQTTTSNTTYTLNHIPEN